MQRFLPLFIAQFLALGGSAAPLGTSFTYNGHLSASGLPATGHYDFRFILYGAEIGGSQVGNILTNSTVGVTNGLFTTSLDFGASVFDGAALWLELAVRPSGTPGIFDPLAPRQPLTPTPYTLFALAAGQVNAAETVPWTGLTGVPAGFADNLDDDTTYTAGTGLVLNGSIFSLADGGVGSAQLASGAVVSRTLAQGAVTTTTLADGAVTQIKVSNDAISTVKLLDGAVTERKLDLGAVTTTKIAQNAVTAENLADAAVATRALATDAVDSQKIADGTILPRDLDEESFAAAFWRTIGNAGTDPGTHFLGTTDNQPLELKVNGARVFRLEPDEHPLGGGFSPNVIAGGPSNIVIEGGTFVFGVTIAGGGTAISPNRAGRGASSGVGAGATVGGGIGNSATDSYSTVAGGFQNTVDTREATVSGGANNTASGQAATIPGGANNVAAGAFSFAAGNKASAHHHGAFVWADAADFNFSSTTNNGFSARCTGGAKFVTGTGRDGEDTAGVQVPAGGNAWQTLSDRNAKENFTPADNRKILDKLAALPLTTWNYKSQDRSIRHIGAMAQDFHATFGVGEDERHITTIDADGVAMAAIQGLHELVKLQEARITALENRNRALEEYFKTLSQCSPVFLKDR